MRYRSTRLFLLLLIIPFAACNDDSSRIKELPDSQIVDFYQSDKSIINYFSDCYKNFELSDKELQLIGEWFEINNEYDAFVANYVFYPNYTIFISLDTHPEENSFSIGDATGIWRVNNKKEIEVKVKRITTLDKKKSNESIEKLVDWDWQEIISINSIHPDGYSIYPFKSIRLPKDLEARMEIKPNYKSQYMLRTFGEPDMQYPGQRYMIYLGIIPFLAKFYPDGTHIYDNEETYQEYIETQRKVSNGELTID